MKPIRLLLFVLALTIAPDSWADEQAAPSASAGAGDVAVEFAKAALKVDVETATKFATKPSAEALREALKTEKSADFAPTLIKVEEKGEKATATVLFPGENRVPILLVKENGEWKVDFVATCKGIDEKAKDEPEPPKPRQPIAKPDKEAVEQAKLTRVKATLENVKTQLQLYEVMNGQPPTADQGLLALVARPVLEPLPKKWRQLLKAVPVDPWGNPYRYGRPNRRSKEGYDLFSAGPDGKPGNEDDVGNW